MANGVVDAETHGLANVLFGQAEAEGSEDLDLRLTPERLRVDEQAVEVEDDRLDGPAGLGVGRRQAGAQASFRTTSTMASPASVGLRATVTPAPDSASILAWAVPLEPEMIAPAWPIFRPGGAVTPAT